MAMATASRAMVTFTGMERAPVSSYNAMPGRALKYSPGGGVTKPHPFVKFKGYGTFTDFIIKNSPAHAISVGTVRPH